MNRFDEFKHVIQAIENYIFNDATALYLPVSEPAFEADSNNIIKPYKNIDFHNSNSRN